MKRGLSYHNLAILRFFVFKIIMSITVFALLDQFLNLIRLFWNPYCYVYDILYHKVHFIKSHKMPFYDILWYVLYDIKCHTHSNMGIYWSSWGRAGPSSATAGAWRWHFKLKIVNVVWSCIYKLPITVEILKLMSKVEMKVYS